MHRNLIDQANGLRQPLEVPDMEAFIAVVAIAVAMLGFDALALRWGADSRPKLADDHRR